MMNRRGTRGGGERTEPAHDAGRGVNETKLEIKKEEAVSRDEQQNSRDDKE